MFIIVLLMGRNLYIRARAAIPARHGTKRVFVTIHYPPDISLHAVNPCCDKYAEHGGSQQERF